jgi:uncharacterized protein
MEALVNVLIILLVYLVPLIAFARNTKWKNYSTFINLIISVAYIVLIFILPSMQSNTLPFVLVIIMINRMKKNTYFNEDYFRYNFSIKNFDLLSALAHAIIGYGMVFTISVISQILFKILNFELESQEVVNILANYDMLKFLIAAPSAVIFAPIVEEYVFRYVLFSKLLRGVFKGRVGFIVSSFFVSLIFASVHYNLAALGMLFVISFYNCYLIEKKGFWYAVFNHFFVNMVTTTLLFISKLI